MQPIKSYFTREGWRKDLEKTIMTNLDMIKAVSPKFAEKTYEEYMTNMVNDKRAPLDVMREIVNNCDILNIDTIGGPVNALKVYVERKAKQIAEKYPDRKNVDAEKIRMGFYILEDKIPGGGISGEELDKVLLNYPPITPVLFPDCDGEKRVAEAVERYVNKMIDDKRAPIFVMFEADNDQNIYPTLRSDILKKYAEKWAEKYNPKDSVINAHKIYFDYLTHAR